MTDQREAIIKFITEWGPVLPIQVAKYLKLDTLFASAMLSEMVARKLLKITKAAIGGSPLYYLQGQEGLMDVRLAESIGGREKQAYALLKEKKVVKESDLEPWQRVAVKSLFDFAVPLKVNIKDQEEIFWKHHLVEDEQAKQFISEILNEKEPIQEELIKNEEPVQKIEEEKPKEIPKPIETIQKFEEKKLEEIINPEINKEKQVIEKKPKLVKKEKKDDNKFYENVMKFIESNNVEILKQEVIKKDKEIDFIVNLFTGFGKMKYYIKAKNKSAINETDVSAAFGESKLKNLPAIFLVNGKMNKKASMLVEQKMQGQLVVKEI